MEFLFKLSHMAVTNIQDEIFDILTPLKIAQQILRIMLCLEVPLFSFTVLMTKLAHKLIKNRAERARLRVDPRADFWNLSMMR